MIEKAETRKENSKIDQSLNLITEWVISFGLTMEYSEVTKVNEKHRLISFTNNIYSLLSSPPFQHEFGNWVLGGVVDSSLVEISLMEEVNVEDEHRRLSSSGRNHNIRKGKHKLIKTVKSSNGDVDYLPTSTPVTARESMIIVRTFSPWDVDKLITSFDDWVKFPPCDLKNSTDENQLFSVDLLLFFSGSFREWGDILVRMHRLVDEFNDGTALWSQCFDNLYFDTANLSQSQDRYVCYRHNTYIRITHCLTHFILLFNVNVDHVLGMSQLCRIETCFG
jgi:hypothetical protein